MTVARHSLARHLYAVSTVLLAFGSIVVGTVSAHTNVQNGGPGPQTMLGHEHKDIFHGNAGCDTLAGRAGNDELWGDASGCDTVRGQAGNDQVFTASDFLPGDAAYGGTGANDVCSLNFGDYLGPSCNAFVYW
jgi:Ca2+-binding RTX toxin-like protein